MVSFTRLSSKHSITDNERHCCLNQYGGPVRQSEKCQGQLRQCPIHHYSTAAVTLAWEMKIINQSDFLFVCLPGDKTPFWLWGLWNLLIHNAFWYSEWPLFNFFEFSAHFHWWRCVKSARPYCVFGIITHSFALRFPKWYLCYKRILDIISVS